MQAWVFVVVGSIVLWHFVMFVALPFFIPFLRTTPLPSRIPKQLEDAIEQIEDESKSKFGYIQGCSAYLLSTNSGSRFDTVLKFPLSLETDAKRLLARRGFMHCTQFNHLLRIMLARSSLFSDDDIRLQKTFLNFSMHQYVQVRVTGQWYDIDLWGMSTLGVPLGKHAVGLR